jgi:hypothetical protein
MSKDWTSDRIFEESVSDLGLEDNWAVYRECDSLVNRGLQDVIENIVSIVASFYMRSALIQVSRTAKRGTGAWTAETRELHFSGTGEPLDGTDVGKLLTMRVDEDIYACTIDAVDEDGVATLSGLLLPEGDEDVDEVQVLGTGVSDDPIDVSSLRIIRTAEARISLESTALKYSVDVLTMDEFLAMRDDDIGTAEIWFTKEGDLLRIRKRIDSYGVLTLHYPQLPEEISGDDLVPVPDASAITLVLARVKKIIAKRAGIDSPDYTEEVRNALLTLATAFKAILTEEDLKKKIEALA